MPANLRIASPRKSKVSGEPCEPLVPGQLAREAIETAGRIHASFLKSLESRLAELLQQPVTTSSPETVQRPFSGVVSDIGSGDRVIALDLSPVRGCGFLTFSPTLLFRVLDILLATPENTAGEERRSVTGIELYILREFFEVFVQSVRDAWEPYYPLAFNQIPAEVEPEPRMVAWGDDLALILRATIGLAGITADFGLVVPAFLARMAHLKSGTATGRAADREAVGGNTLNRLGDATLRMDAVLEGASIRIRDLLGLAPGQVLKVGNSEELSFDCLVNSTRQFAGELIASNGRCAMKVHTPAGSAQGQFTAELAADK